MRSRSSNSGRYLDGVLFAFALGLFLLLPPFLEVWTAPGMPWYLGYVIWLGLIVITALLQLLRRRHEL